MPKLSKPPDPNDPEYQDLERRVNFYLHLALYSACSTCMWFVQSITDDVWVWSIWVSAIWGTSIIGHGIWMLICEKQSQEKQAQGIR